MQPLEIQTGIKEECGVFGIYDPEGGSVSTDIYYGLSALQHRGQESCGIAVSDTAGPKGLVLCHKGLGLVNEVFTEETLKNLTGNIGIGHVRYATTGADSLGYMPVGDLNEMAGGLALCTACFTGTYPMDVPDGEIKNALEQSG